jgi:hypothetical protein
MILDRMPELTGLDTTNSENATQALSRCVKALNQQTWLRSLRLKNCRLTSHYGMFPSLPDLQSLKHLQLFNCDYNAFLQLLMHSSLRLSTNADKKSICLVCKELQAVSTPLLYKYMEVFDDRLDSTLLRTFKPGHHGLPHVRTLDIRNSGRVAPEKMLVEMICRLLFELPRNSLSRFEYDITYQCIIAHGM